MPQPLLQLVFSSGAGTISTTGSAFLGSITSLSGTISLILALEIFPSSREISGRAKLQPLQLSAEVHRDTFNLAHGFDFRF